MKNYINNNKEINELSINNNDNIIQRLRKIITLTKYINEIKKLLNEGIEKYKKK